MIKSLSPYYITIPFVAPLSDLTCTDYTLELFIWNGNKGTPPTEPSYSITKTNPTGSTLTDEIDIANLISDYISFTPQEGTATELLDGNNQLWVKWRTFYTTTDSNDAILPSNQNTKLMTKGCSYGMDGKNAETPTNKILLSGTEFKVNRNGIFVLPIEIAETVPPPPSITITDVFNISGENYQIEFTYVGSYGLIFNLQYNILGDIGINLEDISTTSPETFNISITSETVEVQLIGYDNDTATTIYSNVFTIIIP